MLAMNNLQCNIRPVIGSCVTKMLLCCCFSSQQGCYESGSISDLLQEINENHGNGDSTEIYPDEVESADAFDTDSISPDSQPEIPQDSTPDGNPAYPFCIHDSHCFEDEFCEFPESLCYAPGSCAKWLGVACSGIHDPVCGCDNQSYDEDCMRAQAGVSFMNRGGCTSIVCYPGDPSGVCAEDEFCNGPEGMCDIMGTAGWCERIPANCPSIDDQTCGCDHGIYSNDCERKKQGVWRAHFGMVGYCWSP